MDNSSVWMSYENKKFIVMYYPLGSCFFQATVPNSFSPLRNDCTMD